MKTLRVVWLDPVLKDVHDPNDHEFLILEERLRSVYQKLDSDFKQQAKGDKSLCSNLAYIYELVWIVFFFVQGTMNFLFHFLPSNSFTWLLPRFMERFGLLPAYTYCPKQQENKWHTTVYNHLLFTII